MIQQQIDDYFGISVAISDKYVIVGSSQNDCNGNSNSGSAYIFDINCKNTKLRFDNFSLIK